ncbi:hypothetical protein BV898_13802 [Hypsibius exemplaris]|uniref:RRM domain-containing protein n=1 Tax=Hypsibius exemplaris TaxID=2072580 RepID=A0A1W0W9N0_HYPEX|nr:hypothetical protein BV898_13802 [Hypsibius exemplaris]
MAEKKSKKKEKKTVMDLNQFNSTIASSSGLDWAEELESALPSAKVLPAGPRSMHEPDMDLDAIPLLGPYLLALENAPFEITEQQLYTFFLPIPLKDATVSIEIGRRKMPQVEFESRDHLIRALKEKNNKDINRRTVKLKNPEDFIREAQARGGGGYNNNRGGPDGGYGSADPNRTDAPAGNWRDNLPAQQPQLGGDSRQGFGGGGGGSQTFDRSQMAPFSVSGPPPGLGTDRRSQQPPRDQNFQIERNMEIQYSDRPIGRPDQGGEHHGGMGRQFQPAPPFEDRNIIRRGPDMPPMNDFPRGPPAAQHGGPVSSYGPVPPHFEGRGGGGHQDARGVGGRRYEDPRDAPFVRRSAEDGPPPQSARDLQYQQDRRRGGDDFQIQRNTAAVAPPHHPPHHQPQHFGPPSHREDVMIQRSTIVPQPPAPAPVREQQPPPKAVEPPRERPKLNLLPRQADASLTSAEPASSSAIFGGARPVDTTAKEREMEEKIRKDREALELERQRKLEASAAARAPRNEGDASAAAAAAADHSGVAPQMAAVSLGAGQTRNADGRPVASVPPFRNQSSVSGSEHAHSRPPSVSHGSHTSDVRKLHSQMSNSSSRHSSDFNKDDRRGSGGAGGEEEDARSTTSSQDGFQTVGAKKSYHSRVFTSSTRGGDAGGRGGGGGGGGQYGPPRGGRGGGGQYGPPRVGGGRGGGYGGEPSMRGSGSSNGSATRGRGGDDFRRRDPYDSGDRHGPAPVRPT